LVQDVAWYGRLVCRHRLRHFLFTWLKTQGIDDALIQPYSGVGRDTGKTGNEMILAR